MPPLVGRIISNRDLAWTALVRSVGGYCCDALLLCLRAINCCDETQRIVFQSTIYTELAQLSTGSRRTRWYASGVVLARVCIQFR